MSLIPYHPFSDFDHLWNKIKLSPDGNSSTLLSPKVDVSEKDTQYLINAEFPGIDKKDIKVTLENGILSLEAETHKEEKKEEKGEVIYQERQYGKFARRFNVGNDIQEKDIEAKFKDGVLSLTLPKKSVKENTVSRIPIHS